MPKTDRDKSPIILRRTNHGLAPLNGFDADRLAEYPFGADLEVTIKCRRSIPQLRAYWVMLQRVVDATGSYPTAEHLHEALKLEMGYTKPIRRFNGKTELVPDSVAISAMDAATFQLFFTAAEAKIAEAFGIDPAELRAA